MRLVFTVVTAPFSGSPALLMILARQLVSRCHFPRETRRLGTAGRPISSSLRENPLLARSFVCGCHIISTMLRFHTPLIKPGGRISRTRLSDKAC
jgi:hypothetical protein